ncbi:hypothetical protein T4E_10474 [Trichinella pseudospiralis]|uniref:PiggyBac transposable element-derived protein domain-containing protein n=1 Tax=Trichinella pseudospiralis TaxID=6337 RepID=A0A0V0Y1L7_TRIPS|nr:hypothetical protein T4E_10474 [Trichinella pseudospiralis]
MVCQCVKHADRLFSSNVMKMVTGLTKYAISCAIDLRSVFQLFIAPKIMKIPTKKGSRLLILAGVYKSKPEIAISLWDQENNRVIFPSVTSL